MGVASTKEEVASVVRDLGEQYAGVADSILVNALNGEVLASIEGAEAFEVDILNSLGVENKLHRRVLAKEYQKFSQGLPPMGKSSTNLKLSRKLSRVSPSKNRGAAEPDLTEFKPGIRVGRATWASRRQSKTVQHGDLVPQFIVEQEEFDQFDREVLLLCFGGNADAVKIDNTLVPSMLKELRMYHRSTGFWANVQIARNGFLSLVALVVVVSMPFQIPFGPAYNGIRACPVLVFFCAPLGAFLILHGLTQYLTNLANAPIAPSRAAAVAATGSLTALVLMCILGYGFDVFPIPFWLIVLGVPAVSVVVVTTYLQYPASVRASLDFRLIFLKAGVVAAANVVVAFGLILYNALFANASPSIQSVLALSLPAVKFVAKFASKYMAAHGCNPNFVHGAGMYSELIVGSFCAVLFTSKLFSPDAPDFYSIAREV